MSVQLIIFIASFLLSSPIITFASIINFNGIPEQEAEAYNNTNILNQALNSLIPGDTLIISNKTFWLSGGITVSGLQNNTILLDGTLRFLSGRKGWPTKPCNANKTCVQKAILISDVTGLTLSSSFGYGTVDGNGASWWGYVNYLLHGEDRPKLFTIQNGTNILVEYWHFRQSAYHTFHADDVAGLEIRYSSIDNRVNQEDTHSIENLAALNTDGFDLQGKNMYIHDCAVWNQDDCFTIVPIDKNGINVICTENILIENVKASGLGLTVGSIEPTPNHACIRNVTFRNAYMHHTYKGIYIKSGNRAHPNPKGYSAEITNILYDNITMDEPEQVPIWIGPAQELDSANACSLLWPADPFSKCPAPLATVKWTNITLRNINIINPKESPGLIYGNATSPMVNVTFNNVKCTPKDDTKKPWKDQFYYCKGVQGIATGNTNPIPPCFTNATNGTRYYYTI